MYKGYPFSRTTYYRRKKRAEELGCDIMDVPDGRGLHNNHVNSSMHYRWNDGRMIADGGYVKIRVGKSHPLADSNGYAYEHTLVWVSAGDSLLQGEVLHHINGDKTDNRWENLQRMTKEEHNKLHLPERDSETGQFIGKKAAGRLLDGREWDEMPGPELPQAGLGAKE
jgi:hypothetical protein